MKKYQTAAENVTAGDRLILPGGAREVLSVEPDGDPVDPSHYLITFRLTGNEVRTYRLLADELVDLQIPTDGATS